MFNKLKCIFFLVLVFLTATNCEKKSEEMIKVYIGHDGINQWIGYLNDLGYEKKNDEIVVLFARSADCNKYENEIKWWDNNFYKIEKIDIVLIILEKYAGYYQSAVNVLDVQMPTYQDDTFNALDNEMIQSVPTKLFIDNKNKRILIGRMGTSQSIKNFLEKAFIY